MIELERKQVIFSAKYENALNLKDQSRNDMHDLRTQMANRMRVIEELECRIQALNAEQEATKEMYLDQIHNSGGTEESLKLKIDEVMSDLEGMIKYNSTST